MSKTGARPESPLTLTLSPSAGKGEVTAQFATGAPPAPIIALTG